MARVTRADLYCDNQFFNILIQGNARVNVFRTDMLKLFYLIKNVLCGTVSTTNVYF